MRAYWILPNREQGDQVLASDGKTNLPLRKILDPKLRPDGFSHGVPTELLERWGPKGMAELLFAQRFTGWNGDQQLFSRLTPAGLDASGRVVYLGLLFVLEPHERPRFELSYSSLAEEDKPYARALLQRMTAAGPQDSWAQSVRDLLELPLDTEPATNVALDRSVVPFYSLYELRRGGLAKKATNRRLSLLTAILLLIVFGVLGVWLCVHAKDCSVASLPSERFPTPAIQTGVLKWRGN